MDGAHFSNSSNQLDSVLLAMQIIIYNIKYQTTIIVICRFCIYHIE